MTDSSLPSPDAKACVHCGEGLGGSPHVFYENGERCLVDDSCSKEQLGAQSSEDFLAFCCQGCAQVYFLLKDHQLSSYYQMDQRPGVKVQSSETWLDDKKMLQDENVFRRYLSYEDEDKLKLSWSCPSIHCRACVYLLEKLPMLMPEVVSARVDVMKKRLDVTLSKAVDPSMERASSSKDDASATSQSAERRSESGNGGASKALGERVVEVAEQLSQLGYEPDLSRRPHREDGQSLLRQQEWLRIGVAGFCFGNVMLFSFPEYLSSEDLGAGFQTMFRVLSAVLSLPVFFYCSRGILMSGVKSLRWSQMGVDLPISIGLLALFLWSWYDFLSGQGSGYFDSLCGLVFFLLMGRAFQKSSFQNLVFERDEHRFFPLAISKRVEDQQWRDVPLSQLSEGDVFRITNGAVIPTDAILVEGEARLDYRLVTGESDIKTVGLGESLFAGGLQRGGRITLKAMASVQESSLAQMWSGATSRTGGLEKMLDQIGRVFTFVVIFLAAFTLWLWWPQGIGRALELCCAVLIIACPCALALSAPLSLGMALRALSKVGCYVKDGQVIEYLAKVNLVAFDKTGTLTCVDEQGGAWSGEISSEELLWAAALAEQSSHPVAQAIRASIAEMLLASEPSLGDEPLNSKASCRDEAAKPKVTFDDASRATAVEKISVQQFVEVAGCGMQGSVEGRTIHVGKRSWCEGLMLQGAKGGVNEHVEEVDGARSVASISSSSDETVLMIDGEIKGSFVERLKMREGVDRLLQHWPSGVERRLLSGDDEKDRLRMRSTFGDEHMFFSQSPRDKMEKIEAWSQDRVVAMIGDGVNDALAMKAAHVGLAVPVGSGRFSPSSDVIVSEDHVWLLPKILRFCQGTVKIVVACVVLSFIYNLVGLGFAISGKISPLVSAILMPLSSFSVMMVSVLGIRRWSQRVFAAEMMEEEN